MSVARILVIYDNEESMAGIRSPLELLGYEVIGSDCAGAVSAFVQCQPKLVVIAPCVPEDKRLHLPRMLASLRPRLGVLVLNRADSLQQLLERVSRRKPTVLTVEDRDEARYVVVHHLRSAGFGVLEARNGAEALKQAHRAEAIVLDVHLPDFLGFDVCKRLKADPSTAHIPIIFLTSTAQDSASVQRGREAGAAAYLFSPVESETLIRAVHDALTA